jgi:hypothetical protein
MSKKEKHRPSHLSHDAPASAFLILVAACTVGLIAIFYFFAWALYPALQ